MSRVILGIPLSFESNSLLLDSGEGGMQYECILLRILNLVCRSLSPADLLPPFLL